MLLVGLHEDLPCIFNFDSVWFNATFTSHEGESWSESTEFLKSGSLYKKLIYDNLITT
jgi:hypothetical protein